MIFDTNQASAFFSESQSALMKDVLNRIVPADNKYPGAGDLGLVEHLDRVLTDPIYLAQSPSGLRRLFTEGIRLIERRALDHHSVEFVALTLEQQTETLRYAEETFPQFFNELVRHTYNGYYTNQRILEICGAPIRPPQPTGHRLAPGDLSSLEAVKARGRAYRDA